MKKLQFKININAPIEIVYDKMLGITNKSDYELWTKSFNPTSSYKGDWSEGNKILFIGTDPNTGEVGGMVSIVEKIIPNSFVSIKHIGIVKNDKEITEGPEIESWANAYENYKFENKDGITEITVDIDVSTEEFELYLKDSFPKALQVLKEICEK